MSNTRSVLVTGATGQQGGAVVRALIARGHRVKAISRRPDSEGAKRLTAAGVEVVAGDLDDAASVATAAEGVDTMFLMGNSYEAGTDAETRQGIAVANAAKAAGVGHLIYSSVADADKKTGIPHFDSKYLVEKHIAGLGIPYTISAPVAFMGQPTWLPPSPAGFEEGFSAWITGSQLAERLAWARRASAQFGRDKDPREFLKSTLADAARDETIRVVSQAPNKISGLTLVLASPEFNRR